MSEGYKSTLGERMATPGRAIIKGMWDETEKRSMNNDELLRADRITQEDYDRIKEWNAGAGCDVNGKFVGFPEGYEYTYEYDMNIARRTI